MHVYGVGKRLNQGGLRPGVIFANIGQTIVQHMSRSSSFWKSPVFYVVIIFGVIIMMISLRLSYMLQIFTFGSEANAPTIPSKHAVFTSTLKQPRRFSFIVFRNTSQPDSSIWLSRLCGLPGDTLEMRNGELYVNDRPVDPMFSLSHSFVVDPKDTSRLHPNASETVAIDSAQVLVTCPDKLIREKNISYRRYVVPEDRTDAYMQKTYQHEWNTDHFGPLVVPPDKFFVLGDNRNNAVDSRYIGYVPKTDYRGTVLNY